MPVKAIQQIMLGTVLGNEKKARETLRVMKEAGYGGIELCGYMLRKMPLIIRILTRMAGMPSGGGGRLNWNGLIQETGLQVVGVHEDLNTVSERPDEVIREAERFGTGYVVISGIYRFDFSDYKAVSELAARLNEAGRRLKEGGISLLYHNHNCELRRVAGGKTAFQVLMEETDPAFLNFEYDSYWPAEAGADPLALMKTLGDRMKLWHINDRGSRISGPALTPILKSDSMELGCGNMDLKGLMGQAKRVGVDAVILESHRNWVEKSPVKSFRLSAEFLKELG